jgi:uncharacterized membrane protein
VATFFFLRMFLGWVDGLLDILPARFHPETFLPFPIPGLGLILLFGILLLTGFLVRNYLGRRLVRLWDQVIEAIPLVSKVYSAFKQLVEAIFNRQPQDFKRVVLVVWPVEGSYVLGLVTGPAIGETQRKTQKKVINVFVPTTPNPTSGYFLMVDEDALIPLDLSVEDAFKMMMSGGILTPPDIDKKTSLGGHDVR